MFSVRSINTRLVNSCSCLRGAPVAKRKSKSSKCLMAGNPAILSNTSRVRSLLASISTWSKLSRKSAKVLPCAAPRSAIADHSVAIAGSFNTSQACRMRCNCRFIASPPTVDHTLIADAGNFLPVWPAAALSLYSSGDLSCPRATAVN